MKKLKINRIYTKMEVAVYKSGDVLYNNGDEYYKYWSRILQKKEASSTSHLHKLRRKNSQIHLVNNTIIIDLIISNNKLNKYTFKKGYNEHGGKTIHAHNPS